MAFSAGKNGGQSSGDELTSLNFIKQVWRIEDRAEQREQREQPAGPINTDIYSVPKKGGKIPRRSRNR